MKTHQAVLSILVCAIVAGCSPDEETPNPSFEEQVADYIRKYPYQATYRLAMSFPQGDPAQLHTWVSDIPAIRMNNVSKIRVAVIHELKRVKTFLAWIIGA